ncbi:MAG: hypothetical protein M0Z71_01835 [Nitrospiraceae bacterium]|nr:hypothetical protein [Nitrospiraceae bacterium]
MKNKATVCFKRLQSGEVIGEIIGENREVLISRNFGELANEEIERGLVVFQAENPNTVILPIKLTGN